MNCIHYFIVDPPNGPTSQGVCKFCGFTRSFQNSLGDPSWMNIRDGIRLEKQAKGRGNAKD